MPQQRLGIQQSTRRHDVHSSMRVSRPPNTSTTSTQRNNPRSTIKTISSTTMMRQKDNEQTGKIQERTLRFG